jgi:Pregnancy-associated plasma protein-A
MPPRRGTGETQSDEMPAQRACATDEVNERLLRTVPGYAEARSEIENRTGRVLAFGSAVLRTGCTQIPVVVHVVFRTAAENISDAQIQSQIEVLNADYRATNPDRSSTPPVFAPLIGDARVTFKLADVDPAGAPTSGITRTSTSNSSFNSDTDNVKSVATGGVDPWPADRYLNIWTCGNLRDTAGRPLLGYAQFPGGPPATDGVVILQSAFGTTGTAAAPFNLGRTATHEIGHWLNLRHIWGDDGTGCTGDDFVADTPNAGGPNFGTPTFPHISCGNGPNGDLFMNYMDYVDDAAMFMFTHGQVDRMQAALDGPRSSIGVTGPCAGKPVKEFLKDLPKDFPKEFHKESPKEFLKEFPKDPPKEFPKDPPKEFPKDPPKDLPKEFPKDIPKEFPKDIPKDIGFDPQKGQAGDLPFAGAGGATPFVLGSGRGDAGTDPLLSIVQQLGVILAGYSSAAAQGQLDARDTARWQQLSAVYAQIVALLG